MHNSKGLTLMEVLVTVSILTLVFGMTFGAMRIYDISISMGSTKSNLSAQATQALNKMKEELAKSNPSKIIIVPDMGIHNSLPSNPEWLQFQIPLPQLDANQNIRWGNGITINWWIQYYIQNVTKANQLISEREGTKTVLANDITNLQFDPFPATGNYLDITVTASKPIQRGIVPALSVTMSTRVDFKN